MPTDGVGANAWRWTGPSDIELANADDEPAPDMEGRSESYLGPLVSSSKGPSVWSGHPKEAGRTRKGDGLVHQTTWHSTSRRTANMRPRMNSAGSMYPSGASVSGRVEGSGRVLHQSMHKPKRRHAAGRDPRVSAGAGMMASAKEDTERPVLSSFASSTGWNGPWSPGHSHGTGGASGAIPYSSYHPSSESAAPPLKRSVSGRSSARVGPPQRSTSDLGSTTTTATPVATLASVSSSSGVTAHVEVSSRQED